MRTAPHKETPPLTITTESVPKDGSHGARVVPLSPYEPLPADWREQLVARWPDAERLRWAWLLARDPETCGDLISDRPVDRERLDRRQLVHASEQRLVRLVQPIGLLSGREGAAP